MCDRVQKNHLQDGENENNVNVVSAFRWLCACAAHSILALAGHSLELEHVVFLESRHRAVPSSRDFLPT